MPDQFLLITFWIHMLVTVAWLGSLAAHSFWVFPTLKQQLDDTRYLEWMVANTRRLISISWISVAFLTVSGLFQMSANANYEGFLSIGNRWSLAILVKHLVFLLMLILTVYLSGRLFPDLERAQLLQKKAPSADTAAPTLKRIENIVRLNTWLGALTLALTALARIS